MPPQRSFFVCMDRLGDLDAPLFARMVSASFYLSHDIRRDVELVLVFLGEGSAVYFRGARLRHVHVDEVSLSGVYRKVARGVREGVRRSVHWGVSVEPLSRAFKPPKGYTPSPKGADMSEALRGFPLRFLFGCEGLPLRVTGRPKPVDVTISVLNIALDRVEAGLQPLPG